MFAQAELAYLKPLNNTLGHSPLHGLKPELHHYICSHMGVESVVFSFAEALSDGTGSRDAALEDATWMCDT
ncbi:hypothetical protein GCM10027170_14810 [Aliiglaciecola aliphaticivorans]